MARETGLPCATCGRQTLHRQQGPNHMLHLLLTFLTCTLWAFVWLALTIRATDGAWLCATCGTLRTVDRAPRPGQPARPLTETEAAAIQARSRKTAIGCAGVALAVLLLALAVEIAVDGPAGFLRLIQRTLGM